MIYTVKLHILMEFINKIIKFAKLINNKTWRKGLLNNIAANKFEIKNLDNSYILKIS